MIDTILNKLGLVRVCKANEEKSYLKDIIKKIKQDCYRDLDEYKTIVNKTRLNSEILSKKLEKAIKEVVELKDKTKKLQKEYDNYDLAISIANSNLTKKDNEIQKLQKENKELLKRNKELEYENKYYRNRFYVGLNENISWNLSFALLEDVKYKPSIRRNQGDEK
jgi:chromosome segregation ATPase